MPRSILIAEDDPDIIELLRLYLENDGYQVLAASDGQAAMSLIQEHKVDLAVVDIMMPKMNGYELIRAIRQQLNIPIIILSAKAEDSDKIIGLNIGADDYVTKPFNPLEILARINSNLRRFYELGSDAQSGSSRLQVRELILDFDQITLTKNDELIALTPTEFKILAKLMRIPAGYLLKPNCMKAILGSALRVMRIP